MLPDQLDAGRLDPPPRVVDLVITGDDPGGQRTVTAFERMGRGPNGIERERPEAHDIETGVVQRLMIGGAHRSNYSTSRPT